MRKFLVVGAAALLMLAIAVPLATAGTTTAPKTVTGSFLATYTGVGGGGTPIVVRLEVRTDASGAVQFGYYQQDNLQDPNRASVAVVDSVEFFRAASGAKAARLSLTECSAAYVDPEDGGHCNDQAVVIVTDGTPDTFCGGTPTEPCKYPFSFDKGNISISATTGQNGQ
jgi:hypothetical protein